MSSEETQVLTSADVGTVEVRAIATGSRAVQNPFLQKRLQHAMAFAIEYALSRGISTEEKNSAFLRNLSMTARSFVKTTARPHPEPILTKEMRARPADGEMVEVIIAVEPPPKEAVDAAAAQAVERDRAELVAVLDPFINMFIRPSETE
jgi:hypothetical protein